MKMTRITKRLFCRWGNSAKACLLDSHYEVGGSEFWFDTVGFASAGRTEMDQSKDLSYLWIVD